MQGDLKVAVFTPVKWENRYIREFVEYYQKLGFTNVILADNNEVDGERFEEVIGDYINSRFVIVENCRGQKASETLQNTINQQLWDKYNRYYDWIAVFDADEYLELDKQYRSISDFLNLSKFEGVDEIRLSWKVYGDAGQIKVIRNDYSIESRFKKKDNISPVSWSDGFTKAIYRGRKNIGFELNCHSASHHGANVLGIEKDVNALGQEIDHTSCFIRPPVLEEAWVNHYNTKSLEEFVITKILKGSMEGPYSFYYQTVNPWWTMGQVRKLVEALGFRLTKKTEDNVSTKK